jgi:hypothetical protein
MFYNMAHTLDSFQYILVFPDPHDGPARLAERGVCQPVALDVPT